MKKLLLPLLALAITACSGNANSDGDSNKENASDQEATKTEMEAKPAMSMAYFGEKIDEASAAELDAVVKQMSEKDSLNIKLKGQVDKVCQVKGCWMTMAYGEGESMRISFRDYGFFVPKDIDGKEVVVDGTVYTTTTSVDDLKHYAEDEGQTPEEIAMITEPETALSFVADGVIIKDYKVETDAAKAEEQNMEHGHDHSEEGHSH